MADGWIEVAVAVPPGLEELAAEALCEPPFTGVQLLDLRAEFLRWLRENNPDNLERGLLTDDRVHLNAAGNRFAGGAGSDPLLQ